MADDTRHMRQAIALAAARVGLTGENPAVGCVLVREGVVIAEAVTAEGGRPHAEEQALAIAGVRAAGATAYVTLEPCGERSAGAPSCAARLIGAGVTRVAVACADPSVMASGSGVSLLRSAGVEVDLALLADEAAGLYQAYFSRLP